MEGTTSLKLADTVVLVGGIQSISLTSHDKTLYVLNAGDASNIAGFRLPEAGKLAPIPNPTGSLSGSVVGQAQLGFSPKGKLLVVTEKVTNESGTYTVDEAGLAKGLPPSPPLAPLLLGSTSTATP